MPNFSKAAFKQLEIGYRDRVVRTTIGADELFYAGKGNLAQRLNIRLSGLFPTRNDRLSWMSYMTGRTITSTKDLTVSECRALIDLMEASQ